MISDTLKKTEFISLTFLQAPYNKLIDNNNSLVIGNDYENIVYLDLSNNQVYSLSLENNEKIFINSSINFLEKFIDLFNEEIDFYEDYDEQKRNQQVKKLKKEYLKLDKTAINEESWWSFILEQVNDGLL